jgi:hypothetical protein
MMGKATLQLGRIHYTAMAIAIAGVSLALILSVFEGRRYLMTF